MHWSVRMLLHAVCVFFYKGKKKNLEKLMWERFPDYFLIFLCFVFFCQHGAVDLDIPFMQNLDFVFNFSPQ